MDLTNAHVLVTGASRGIGAAMAREFASAGAKVSVVARSADALHAVAGPIGATVFTADLSDADQVDGLIARVEAEAGPIDVLMSNAGLEENSHVHNTDPATMRTIMRLNMEAPIILTRNVLTGMLDRNNGHLAYTCSLAGTAGFPGLATYGATKAGLMNFASALRLELRDTNIKTTVVAPGPIDTEMWDNVESGEDTAPVIKRLNRLFLIPIKSPESLAEQTVSAVRDGHRHVRTPRRLSSNFWFREAPSRITELVMTGVRTGPKLN